MPKIDENEISLSLTGASLNVTKVIAEFYKMKASILEDNYASLVARHVIWANESENGTYQRYPLKVNALIEDSFQAGQKSVC